MRLSRLGQREGSRRLDVWYRARARAWKNVSGHILFSSDCIAIPLWLTFKDKTTLDLVSWLKLVCRRQFSVYLCNLGL